MKHWWPFKRRPVRTPLSREEKWLEIATIAVEQREHLFKHSVDRDTLIRDLAQAGASALTDDAAVDAMEPMLEAAEPGLYWDGSKVPR